MKSRRFITFPVLAMFVVMAIFGIWYFVYVTNQQEYFRQRDLRQLDVMGNQVLKEIETREQVLKYAPTITQAENDSNLFKIDEYLSRAKFDNLRIDTIDLNPQSKADSLKIWRLGSDSTRPRRYRYRDTVMIVLRPNFEKSVLWYVRTDTIHPQKLRRIIAEYPIEKLMGRAIPPSVFDVVVVSDNSGQVVYHQEAQGILITQMNAVIGDTAKGMSFAKLSQTGGELDAIVSKDSYRLFVWPLHLPIPTVGSTDGALSNVRWVICGLIRSDRFIGECLQISYNKLMFVLAILLVALLSMSFVKIHSLHRHEKLTLLDIHALGVSIIFGLSILTMLLVDALNQNDLISHEFDVGLKTFAERITSNFENETKDILAQLDTINTEALARWRRSLKKSLNTKEIIAASRDHSIERGFQAQKVLSDTSGRLYSYPFFDQVAWLDSSGLQFAKWTASSARTPLVSVADREYFTIIRDSIHSWVRENNRGRYCIQPVYSFTSSKFTAVVSTPMTGMESVVAAIESRLISVVSPVVPFGFGYSIVNENGTVLFHSSKEKNLNENFLDECRNDPELRSALMGHSAKIVLADYWGADHHMFVKPMKGIPWCVVTFYNQEILRSSNLEIITIAMFLFILYVVALGSLSLGFSVSGLFGGRGLSWLWPDRNRHRSYLRLLASAAIISFAMLLSAMEHHHDHAIILTAVFPMLMVAIAFRELGHVRAPFFIVLFLSVVLLCINKGFPENAVHLVSLSISSALTIFILESRRAGVVLERYAYPFMAICLLTFVAVLLNLVVGEGGTTYWLVFSCIALVLIYLMTRPFVSEESDLRWPVMSFRTSYTAAGSALIILIAVIPSIVFFKISYEEQMELLTKHGQFNIARSLEKRHDRIVSDYSNNYLADTARLDSRRMADERDIYANVFFNTKLDKLTPSDTPETTDSLSIFHNLFLGQAMPQFTALCTELHSLIADKANDALWTWTKSRVDSVSPDSLILSLRRANYSDTSSVSLSSTVPRYGRYGEKLSWWGWTSIIFLIVAVLLIVVAVARFIASKVFLIDADNDPVIYTGKTVLRTLNRNILFLIPSPNEKNSILKKLAANHFDLRKLICVTDWSDTFEYGKLDERAVVIDSFEYLMHDPEQNRQKLRFLDKLIYTYGKTVILFSTVDPGYYFTVDAGTHKSDGAAKGLDDLDRWHMILGSFERIQFHPPRENSQNEGLEPSLQSMDRSLARWERVIHSECRHDREMDDIGTSLLESPEMLRHRTHRELVTLILDRARSHYQGLWAICSPSEKLVLIRLSRHGWVSPRNLDIVNQLLTSRLIVRDPRLRPMNESFRRFILEVQRPYDTRMPSHAADETAWRKLRTPFLMLLFGIGVFLLVTQPGVFNTSTVYITTATGLLTAVLKLVDVFRSSRSAAKVGG